ncbi:MAG TPA: DUF1634 domain-containing protein [Ktedonobacterales bacterium]|nr:DUF1634 domain-containing protein [Ktedonobacterales bacterium]
MHQSAEGEADDSSNSGQQLAQAELIISYVLRGGVLLSAGVILLGVMLFYIRYAAKPQSVDTQTYPHSLGGVVQGVTHGNPLAVISLGLLILLATPTLRVVISIITFAIERDWLYTAITALVLFILLVSFLLGGGGA